RGGRRPERLSGSEGGGPPGPPTAARSAQWPRGSGRSIVGCEQEFAMRGVRCCERAAAMSGVITSSDRNRAVNRFASRHGGCSWTGSMRTFSHGRVILPLVFWAFATSVASAQSIFYLRAGSLLSQEAPGAAGTTAMISTTVPNGEDILIGTFASVPVGHDVS